MIRAAALLLLLSATSAYAASFDGTWQSVGREDEGSRFNIHGYEVRHLIERNGKFIEEGDCLFGIERGVHSAYISFLECSGGDDGTLLVITDRYLLTKKDNDTLRVRTEKQNGKLIDDGDWVRVR